MLHTVLKYGGGVIGFWPAFGVGLGLSFVAGVFYVVAWEGVQAVMHMDFATAEMAAFKVQYAKLRNPRFLPARRG